MYSSANAARRIDFLKAISYAHRHLPAWMQKPHTEGPNGFFIGTRNGEVIPIGTEDSWKLCENKYDYVIFDDITIKNRFSVDEFINLTKMNKAKMSIIGTFKPNTPLFGEIWSESRKKKNDWTSLPSINEEWKVNTILSLVNPIYSADY